VWQRIKNAWRETCEETLERKSKQHRAYVSKDTLRKIETRKKEKDVLNRNRTRAEKMEARTRYPKDNRLSKASEKTEGTSWTTLQDRQRKQ